MRSNPTCSTQVWNRKETEQKGGKGDSKGTSPLGKNRAGFGYAELIDQIIR